MVKYGMSTNGGKKGYNLDALSAYLILYNVVQALGWGYVLILLIQAMVNGRNAVEFYKDAGGMTSKVHHMHGKCMGHDILYG